MTVVSTFDLSKISVGSSSIGSLLPVFDFEEKK